MTPPFDPDAPAGPGSGIYGLPSTAAGAAVHVQGVPFDATTSYRQGAAHGPRAILAASRQVELYDLATGRPYEAGIHMHAIDERVDAFQREATALARPVIEAGGMGDFASALERVDAIGAELNAVVRERTAATLGDGKLPCLVGGDHSTPFGAIEACAEKHPGLGVLHFDAHADLRRAYEGFAWSHASILFNVVERLDGVAKVVQVGVRDAGEEELERILGSEDRIETLFDPDWARAKLAGEHLRALVRAWIAKLPSEVYVTFDVDGLDPALCPNTGTPVPGGLGWHEALLWLEELAISGKRVVGLDVNEVSPGPDGDAEGRGWDAIVGARLLYRLIGTALVTRA